MKKLKQKPEEEIYYVGIQEPLEVRRSILEASKELLLFMQRYEKYKEVRNEKREAVALLKAQMKDLSGLITDLKGVLPQNSLRAEERYEKKAITERIIIPPVIKVPLAELQKEVKKPEMSEIEKLETELAEIEGRLNDLT